MSRQSKWQNRITGEGEQPAAWFLANPKNWRVHPTRQQRALQGNLDTLGWITRVVVNQRTGFIVDGHMRVTLALRAGEDTPVPVTYVDLSEEEEAQALATLDPIAAMAATDKDQLERLLQEIDTDNDLVRQMSEDIAAANRIDLDPSDPDDDELPTDPAEKLNEEWQVKPGDTWEITAADGRTHRLICGDSLEPETYEQLTKGRRIDLYLTDPPYNVDYTSPSTGQTIENDDMDDAAFLAFLTAAFIRARESGRPGTAAYIFHADSQGLAFRQAFRDAGYYQAQTLAWVKNAPTLGRQDYQWKHEPILYGWLPGQGHYFTAARYNTTVFDLEEEPDLNKLSKDELKELAQALWENRHQPATAIDCNKPSRNPLHPTMKPVKLLGYLIRNSSMTGDAILDNFMGSGSTLVAAERNGRICYGIEKDPKYMAVSLERMKTLGFTPRKV